MEKRALQKNLINWTPAG